MSQETIDPTTSPARRSRQQEKEELAYLNDRFASYIEQVRSLKESNLRYEYELQTVKEQLGNESEDIKKLFEAELTDARTLIDETAKEKARQQLNASKNGARVRELEAEMKDLKEELETMKNRASAAERNANSFDAQRKAAISDKASLQKEVKNKDIEIEELRASVDDLKTLLENETLCKVDYQNNLQSLNEELSFRKKIYEEELQSMRMKISRTSYSETYESFAEGGHLESAIDELREKSDTDIASFKTMLDAAYKDKISKLENQSSRDSTTISQLNMELRKFTASMSDNKGDVSKYQKIIEKLEGQLDCKENEIARLVQKHSSDTARMMDELRALRENYDIQMREYEVLMDLKVQLDQEIATYRALLQEEESRLNLTPTPRGEKRRSRTQNTEQSVKKARLDTPTAQQQSSVSSSAAGCIQICDVDAQGRFVQIKNMSKSAESVGGFKIIHDVNGEKDITFKFHQKSKLQGGASVTVWGSEVDGAVHNPPHDIIWRNQGTWGAGTNAVTKLISKTGEVVATFTQRSETSPVKGYETIDSAGASVRSFPHLDTSERDSPSTTSRTVRTTTTTTTGAGAGAGGRVGEEDMFHQRGDPQGQEHLERRENCVIS